MSERSLAVLEDRASGAVDIIARCGCGHPAVLLRVENVPAFTRQVVVSLIGSLKSSGASSSMRAAVMCGGCSDRARDLERQAFP